MEDSDIETEPLADQVLGGSIMPYYAYVAPMCGYCGKEQGLVEVEGGRQRLYCSDRCKVAAYRQRNQHKKRNMILLRNTELRDYWQENGIEGELLTSLQKHPG